MKENIKGIRKNQGNYILHKNRNKDNFVITSAELASLAKEQEGNKILEALNNLKIALRGREELEESQER